MTDYQVLELVVFSWVWIALIVAWYKATQNEIKFLKTKRGYQIFREKEETKRIKALAKQKCETVRFRGFM